MVPTRIAYNAKGPEKSSKTKKAFVTSVLPEGQKFYVRRCRIR